ncbi:MAG TPA: anti-sigma factor [Candidatus Acidoferrales bacterium]|nr:anti-sigma factor [Candidatus Acidoferrales bacterium]
MDCSTYIEKYLAAQVDGELSAEELREAEEHLAGCAECRARFAEERAVKSLLRERAQMLRTPAMVRGSILAALDAADNAERRRSVEADAQRPTRSGVAVLRRARYWVPTALAAAAVFAFVMLRGGGTPAHAIPAFDVAIENYEHFVDHFEPNVPSDSPANISDAYMDHKLPGFLWNFQPSGYKLIGGRLDHLADGTPVSYTFYRGESGTILCVYMKSHGLEPPQGATRELGGHSYYVYRGYSICLSYPRGDFICVLISRRSMNQFVQDIVASEY